MNTSLQTSHRRKSVLKTSGAVGAITLLMLGNPAFAQQSEIDALKAQLAELTARLGKLEDNQTNAATAAAAAAKAGNPITSKEKVVVSGLLQVQGLGYLDQDKAFPRKADTFRLRRGELRLTMPNITPHVSGTVMFDPAKAINGATNIAAGTNLNIRARDNVLQEIIVSYLLNKDPKWTNTVDIGQYKIPVGYESTIIGSGATQLVERSLIFSQRDPAGTDSGYGDVRDTGIQLRGSYSGWKLGTVDYRAGVFNGLGDRQNTLASNDQKAVLGWVALSPKALSGLTFGVSGGGGNNASAANGSRFNRGLFNAFATYKKDKWTLLSEYLKGTSQLRGGAAFSDISGYYASVGYLFTPKIEGVLRYDSLDTNRTVANADVSDSTIGVNYYIKGNNARIQANIVRRNGGPASPIADLRPDRTELRTNFQVQF